MPRERFEHPENPGDPDLIAGKLDPIKTIQLCLGSGSDISISNESRLLTEVSLAIETFRWEHFLTIPEPVRSNYSKVQSFLM